MEETGPEVQPEPQAEGQPEVQPDGQPEVQPDGQPEVQPDGQPEGEPDPQGMWTLNPFLNSEPNPQPDWDDLPSGEWAEYTGRNIDLNSKLYEKVASKRKEIAELAIHPYVVVLLESDGCALQVDTCLAEIIGELTEEKPEDITWPTLPDDWAVAAEVAATQIQVSICPSS
eukprot:596432-Prorocentrum_minimum.AAC.2